MRGAGDLIGTAQSGLPRFRVADMERQSALMAVAQSDARALLAADPALETPRGRAARNLAVAAGSGPGDPADFGRLTPLSRVREPAGCGGVVLVLFPAAHSGPGAASRDETRLFMKRSLMFSISSLRIVSGYENNTATRKRRACMIARLKTLTVHSLDAALWPAMSIGVAALFALLFVALAVPAAI
jgi:hypothetical protein